MITGEIKNKIDSIWDAFWTGGITNSITVLEQMTYLFFMKMLDDAQRTKEANAAVMGVPVPDPIFRSGEYWKNPETGREVLYDSLARVQEYRCGDDVPHRAQRCFSVHQESERRQGERVQPFHGQRDFPDSDRADTRQNRGRHRRPRHEQPRHDGRCLRVCSGQNGGERQ